MDNIKGLATGIGSFPHQDADEALDLIFRYTPKIPFWPQLPKRTMREGMITQFSERIPGLKVIDTGLFFDAANKEQELERFYEHLLNDDVEHFKLSADFALGLHKFLEELQKRNLKGVEFIKCQVSGPFTFAAAIKDEKEISLLHDAVFMQVIVKALTMKARWQVDSFKKFNKKIMLFFDEPYLGCFGSGYTPINRDAVLRGLTELSEPIASEDVLVGVHCCGNTDWSILTEVPSIKIISFDAFGFQERFLLYAQDIRNFLKRGGIICWGIVPTQEFSASHTAAGLVKKLMAGIDSLVKKGVDKDLLLERLLVSPSCGLGSLDARRPKEIFKILSETSSLLMS